MDPGLLIHLHPVAPKVHGHGICGLPEQAAAKAQFIVVLRLGSIHVIAPEAIALVASAGEANGQLIIDQRNVHCGAEVQVVVVADIAREITVHAFEVRLSSEHVDGAASGVAPVQGSLGAFEHLDAVHVVKIGLKPIGSWDVHAVLIHANGRVGGH